MSRWCAWSWGGAGMVSIYYIKDKGNDRYGGGRVETGVGRVG